MMNFEAVRYIPILSLKPAEMVAIEELPEKDKDIISPLFVLKRWVGSRSFKNTLDRLKKAFRKRPCFVDLDYINYKELEAKEDGSHKQCYEEMSRLFDSEQGYKNWVSFIIENENFIPVLQIHDLNQLEQQVKAFIELGRGFVLRLKMYELSNKDFNTIIRTMINPSLILRNYLILLDYGDLGRANYLEYEKYSILISQLRKIFPYANLSFSGTSFPYSFTGSYKGEIPIYERQIYNKIVKTLDNTFLIYSDRASTRTFSLKGSGTPPPRIDYALKNDWRFVRKEPKTGMSKEDLYAEAAIEIISSEYWEPDLRLWGTQLIEKTSLYDDYGINNPNKATAVRVNLHLYQQLHYLEDLSDLDTDEEWVD